MGNQQGWGSGTQHFTRSGPCDRLFHGSLLIPYVPVQPGTMTRAGKLLKYRNGWVVHLVGDDRRLLTNWTRAIAGGELGNEQRARLADIAERIPVTSC